MRLLAFDDDEAIGRLVVRVAKKAGFDAAAVAEPAAFRRSLIDSPPQIILLDLQLGLTDGVEQLRYLADQHFAGSIIVMSGFDARVLATAATVAKNLDLNIIATLAKPIRVAELEKIIQRLRPMERSLSAETLLAAIHNDELSLEFQPIVDAHTRSLNKVEALVRWEHPYLGQVPPNEFLPLAETNREVIDALTDWVMSAAVEAWQVLRDVGLNVPITVNVSTLNLHDLALPDRIARRLGTAGMPAEDLCLEITESAASQDPVRMMDILTRVRLKGIQLAIDDFGTGYSSLKALRQLPFSVIKIDRSFIADLTTSADSLTIVKSIIDLASNLGMSTIAEGVETEEAARLLEEMKVDALQGYLIGRPVPVESIPAWLATWTKANKEPPRPDAGAGEPRPAEPQSRSGRPALTPRQIDVIRLLTQGCSVKEIARRLGLGIGTVKVHLSLAYSALGASNRVEAVLRASSYLQEDTGGAGPAATDVAHSPA